MENCKNLRNYYSKYYAGKSNCQSNNIYIGLTLYIPAPRYQVQPREALWQIAQKLHISLQTVDDMSLLSASASNNVVPIMSITNFTATSRGENLAHIILASTTLQETLFANIINIMKNKGYRGVNIDFENVLPADRDLYNSLLQRMVDRFHTEGYFVSTALAPKISVQQLGSLYEAHDYEAHGRIADFVVLMTYEWGCRFCPPQAISPLNQIKRVLDYAVTVIPREKIFFSFQLYDTVTQSPYYRYADEQGRMHEVWFEDARSAQAKFDTVKQYNLRGISYWASGFPFPQN